MTLKLKDKRIFIIEDNLSNRAIMQILLEQDGATTSFERWGTDILSRLKAFEPVDIILLDLMFPRGVTGYDLFEQIRKDNQFINVPIVAVSASDASEAIPKTKEKGFSGFISKPFNYNRFPDQILAVLNKEEVWDIG